MLFSDVILVSDDLVPIEAHKTILSYSSPFFKKLLCMDNSNSKPFLFLKGVKYEHLVLLMQFLYVGETVIGHEDVGEFIQIGKDFEIETLLSHSEKVSKKSEVGLEDELSEDEEEELSEEEEYELGMDSAGNEEDVSLGEKSSDSDFMKSKETSIEGRASSSSMNFRNDGRKASDATKDTK